jgi:hypothetical protein
LETAWLLSRGTETLEATWLELLLLLLRGSKTLELRLLWLGGLCLVALELLLAALRWETLELLLLLLLWWRSIATVLLLILVSIAWLLLLLRITAVTVTRLRVLRGGLRWVKELLSDWLSSEARTQDALTDTLEGVRRIVNSVLR